MLRQSGRQLKDAFLNTLFEHCEITAKEITLREVRAQARTLTNTNTSTHENHVSACVHVYTFVRASVCI